MASGFSRRQALHGMTALGAAPLGLMALGSLAGAGPAQAQIKYPTADMARQAEVKADMWKRLPDFPLWTTAGEEIRFWSFRGKVTMLHFWGSWCPPCRNEMPQQTAFYAKFRNEADFRFALVVYGESFATGRKFLSDSIGDADVYDPRDGGVLRHEKNLYRHLSLRKVPATILVDRNGLVFYWKEDSTDWAFLQRELPGMLAHSAPFIGS